MRSFFISTLCLHPCFPLAALVSTLVVVLFFPCGDYLIILIIDVLASQLTASAFLFYCDVSSTASVSILTVVSTQFELCY